MNPLGIKQFVVISTLKTIVELITSNYEKEVIQATWYPHYASFTVRQGEKTVSLSFTLLDNGNIQIEIKTWTPDQGQFQIKVEL